MLHAPIAMNTASKTAVDLASRSGIRSLRILRFISRLRACWATHMPELVSPRGELHGEDDLKDRNWPSLPGTSRPGDDR
jgi:hypothetical protein